jgi:hypothetical protein
MKLKAEYEVKHKKKMPLTFIKKRLSIHSLSSISMALSGNRNNSREMQILLDMCSYLGSLLRE